MGGVGGWCSRVVLVGGVDGRCWRVLMGKALFVAEFHGSAPDSLRINFSYVFQLLLARHPLPRSR